MSNDPLQAQRIAGTPGSPVAVLLHGFTQNLHCWGPFAHELGEGYDVWALDLPGHGSSGHELATFEDSARLVADRIEMIRQDAGPVDLVVGYSMGGRIALRAAIDQTLDARLVLIGATAGIEGATARAERREADRGLADRLRADGPDAFLQFWLDLPLFSGLSEQQHLRQLRLDHWGVGVPETLLHRGTGSMESLWDRLGQVVNEVLILAGEADTKFTDLGHRLNKAIGAYATFTAVPDSGHACHLEQPETTADIIMRWHRSIGAQKA